MLVKEEIPFGFREGLCNGYQIRYPNHVECVCSVIQHDYSYGKEEDLLEIKGLLTDEELMSDGIVGYITAEEVFERIKAHWTGKGGKENA